MRLHITALSCILMFLAFGQERQERIPQERVPATVEQTCAPLGVVRTRTTLYFGLSKPGGAVTESEWHSFLQHEVTPRFPEGLTVWQADGQWREANGKIGHERAKVLLLVHEQSPELRPAIAGIIAAYKRSFAQESVLWE